MVTNFVKNHTKFVTSERPVWVVLLFRRTPARDNISFKFYKINILCFIWALVENMAPFLLFSLHT